MGLALASEPTELPVARLIAARATERWQGEQSATIVGRHPSVAAALDRAVRFARCDSPVLITGETGTGKELFARAVYLLSGRLKGPMVTVNCAQYQEGQIIASELFGHKRGSFTGAVGDHRGIFESAEGGVVFLDEVGELSSQAQAMLLRLLSEGEIVPVGESRARRVNVRTVMATNRNLKEMVEAGRFRADLFYRIRHLQITVPPVRTRGDDWAIIAAHYLGRLAQGRERKRFSCEAMALLERHDWPGNVREIRGVVDTAFHLSEGPVMEPDDFTGSLEAAANTIQINSFPLDCAPVPTAAALFSRLIAGEGTFWDLVHQPYMDRELNRPQVREVVALGLGRSGGSYKRMLGEFGMPLSDYLKFMDFLRHHRLKPGDCSPAGLRIGPGL
jgi:transcriptional regulator with GAF, ATPase, and Fis domain